MDFPMIGYFSKAPGTIITPISKKINRGFFSPDSALSSAHPPYPLFPLEFFEIFFFPFPFDILHMLRQTAIG